MGAKCTDIQDKNGVLKEVQDKDLANQTSASTINSSDYVMLQDTNGGYHKISKASFTEAVRGALGSVINSVAKGSDIAKVPVLDSNNDLGMGTLANLASVLGDLLGVEKIVRTTDVPSPGTWTITRLCGKLELTAMWITESRQSLFMRNKSDNTWSNWLFIEFNQTP